MYRVQLLEKSLPIPNLHSFISFIFYTLYHILPSIAICYRALQFALLIFCQQQQVVRVEDT